jgi:uncharacterized protein YfkK (UPF0435 family)
MEGNSMSCAIILNATNDKSIAASMVSILENTYQPKVVCILTNKNTDNKQLEIARSFLKSCCDGGTYSEEVSSRGTISKKENDNITIVLFNLNNASLNDAKNIAFEYIYDDVDYIFTINSGTKYVYNYIEEILSKLKIENTGCVYSDYIEDNSIKHLSYFHPMLNHQIAVKEIAFNKNLSSKTIFSLNEFQILSDFYNKSIIRHIAEPLFVI